MTNTDLPNIFQIYISDDGSGPSEALSDAIASVKKCFSAYQYSLHNNDSLRAFIEENFDNEVVESYDKLRPFAYKADLGRYCLLYQLGGWYSDISIMMRQPVNLVGNNIDLVYFFDLGDGVMPGRSLFDVSNSLLYSKPRNSIFENAIKMVVKNCKQEYYGTSIYCPTGPGVLGTSIANTKRSNKHISGHLMALTPNHPRRNLSFVLPDGQILALFKKGWMAPNELLFGQHHAGTNDYAELWAKRQVYGA
jgi:mannosyltransferase OCH1-like enzyme